MSVDPSEALQIALAAALLAASPVTTLLGGAYVYDPLSVPNVDRFPYIEIGEGQDIGDDDSCGSRTQSFVDLHVWARGPDGRLVAKRIANAVREALQTDLVLTGHVLISQVYETTRHLTDPDGLTAHAVITFMFRTRPST